MEAKDSQHILKDCKKTGEVKIILFTLTTKSCNSCFRCGTTLLYFGSADSLFDLSLDNPSMPYMLFFSTGLLNKCAVVLLNCINRASFVTVRVSLFDRPVCFVLLFWRVLHRN